MMDIWHETIKQRSTFLKEHTMATNYFYTFWKKDVLPLAFRFSITYGGFTSLDAGLFWVWFSGVFPQSSAKECMFSCPQPWTLEQIWQIFTKTDRQARRILVVERHEENDEDNIQNIWCFAKITIGLNTKNGFCYYTEVSLQSIYLV